MISGFVLSLLVAVASCAPGTGVVPTAPGPGQVFKEGGDCTFSWNLDTTGKWTSFTVDLMSGSNTAMQMVTNVFKQRDGTKGETSYTWKCPAVSPHSAIYFYQFTQAGADTTWTTRFAISSPTGEVTAPANSLQPDGAQIPWGIGHLAGAGAESAPTNTPTTAPSSTANTTAINTPSPATANTTNSTMGSPAGAANTSSASVPGSAAAGSTGSSTGSSTGGSSPTGSNSKTPPTTLPSTPASAQGSSNTAVPTSAAHTINHCKSAIVSLSLAAIVIVA